MSMDRATSASRISGRRATPASHRPITNVTINPAGTLITSRMRNRFSAASMGASETPTCSRYVWLAAGVSTLLDRRIRP